MITARVPHELVARLDAYCERVAARMPGMKFSRADAVRVLLTIGLDREEGTADSRRR